MITKKHLGQHWLHDQQVLTHICNAAELTPADTVLEIGPGLGTLTQELTSRAKKVIAVEFDSELAKQLPGRVPAKNLDVAHADILRFDLQSLPAGYKVVANLPYYITSKIVRLLLEATNPPSLATLLVQKEVAQRMAASPGTMSILAVAVQFYAESELGPVVPARLFSPPPQVDSQIITLKRRSQPLFPDVETKSFFRLVKAGFGEKRKTLRNSLSGGLDLERGKTEALLAAAGIAPTARAEQLGLEDWYRLAKTLEAQP